MNTRDELESKTLAACSAENYFDFAAVMDDLPDDELYRIIACKGDYQKEIGDNPTFGPVLGEAS